MAVSASWDNDQKTIIRYAFTGNWTWNEFYSAVKVVHDLQDSVDHRVDIILDLADTHIVPEGILLQFRRLAGITHPNTGVRVIVSQSSTVTVLFETFIRVYTKNAEKYRIAKNVEQAYAIINEARMD